MEITSIWLTCYQYSFSIAVITQVSDQLKGKDTSQFINNIVKLFRKLPRCFNGKAISTSFVPLLFLSNLGLFTGLPSAPTILLGTL